MTLIGPGNAIRWEVIERRFIAAAVRALNETAARVEDVARSKAPVRKVFKGGRQTVRLKTAAEIEADRALRSRLGLGPEIGATPEAIARSLRAGKNPKRGQGRYLNPKYRLPGGETVGAIEEFAFARTVEHPGRTHTEPWTWTRGKGGSRPGVMEGGERRTHTDRPRNLRNRANTEPPGVDPLIAGRLQLDEMEQRLSSRGRYELRSGRAIRAGRLGGALRGSIHVVPATAKQYPVIKASVVAGGREAPYAKYQELGTRHNPAHPFLRPALAVGKDVLPVQLKRAVHKIVGGPRR